MRLSDVAVERLAGVILAVILALTVIVFIMTLLAGPSFAQSLSRTTGLS